RRARWLLMKLLMITYETGMDGLESVRLQEMCRKENSRDRKSGSSEWPMRCSADSWRDMMWGRKPILGKTKAPIRPELESELGAGDENRTRTICLEGRGSTIELHPRTAWATDITITHKLRSCKTGTCSLRKFITWFGWLWCRGFLVSC